MVFDKRVCVCLQFRSSKKVREAFPKTHMWHGVFRVSSVQNHQKIVQRSAIKKSPARVALTIWFIGIDVAILMCTNNFILSLFHERSR